MSPLLKDTKQVPAKSCRTPEHFSFKRYLWKINPFLSCYYGYGITINFHPPYSKCYKISLKFKMNIEIPAATESIAFLESFWSVLQNSTGPAGPCIKYRSMAPLIYFIYLFFFFLALKTWGQPRFKSAPDMSSFNRPETQIYIYFLITYLYTPICI